MLHYRTDAFTSGHVEQLDHIVAAAGRDVRICRADASNARLVRMVSETLD